MGDIGIHEIIISNYPLFLKMKVKYLFSVFSKVNEKFNKMNEHKFNKVKSKI